MPEEKETINCDLCKKEIILKDEEILNGHQLVFDTGYNKITVFRCKECFKKDQSLKNYREIEIFTRVVGYLRPVKHFNPGKQQEFKERKDFKLK